MATSILGQTAVRAAKLEVVTELPEIGKKNQIYLVPNKSSVSGDIYDEYIWINDTWEFLGNKRLELTIDSILKPDSTNPVENKAIYSRFLGVDKDIELNKNNIGALTGRVNEVDGIAKGTEALAKVNEERLNGVQATANTALKNSERNQDSVRNAQVTANEAKASVEGLTIVTKRMEVNVSQLQELNVVYPNNIRNLTTESTIKEIQDAFIPAIGGSAGVVNTPHVGYLIKGAAYEDSSEDNPEYGPDSTIISVDIIKTDNKDYHKFIYVDNNTAIISVTVDLANYKIIDKSTLTNIETTSKVGTLRDLYISAGAVYNERTGYYELNGLTDITEEQMRVIYKDSKSWAPSGWMLMANSKMRTNLPITGGYFTGGIGSIFENCENIEVINMKGTYGHDSECVVYKNYQIGEMLVRSFRNCPKLKKIMGILNINTQTYAEDRMFELDTALESVKLKGWQGWKFSFKSCPNISKESILYLINNSFLKTSTTGSAPIELHPTAYTRLKDDADIVAALEAKGGIVTLVSA